MDIGVVWRKRGSRAREVDALTDFLRVSIKGLAQV
jgi:hypothetical protein